MTDQPRAGDDAVTENEIDRLRRLLEHMVWVVEDRLGSSEIAKCELCREAKGASREP